MSLSPAPSAALLLLAVLVVTPGGPGRMVALAVPCECQAEWSAAFMTDPDCARPQRYCPLYTKANYPRNSCFRAGYTSSRPRAWCLVKSDLDRGGSRGGRNGCDELNFNWGSGGPDANPTQGVSRPSPSPRRFNLPRSHGRGKAPPPPPPLVRPPPSRNHKARLRTTLSRLTALQPPPP